MNLDTTAEKEKMKDAYHAYLENTPGSKKALQELLTKKHLIGIKDGKTKTEPPPKEVPVKAAAPTKPKAPEKSNLYLFK